MAINDILSDIAQKLGLKDTELKTLKKACEGLEKSVGANSEKLNQLKEEVADLDALLRVKKRAYEEAKGEGLKKIAKREIITIFKRQDRLIQDVDMFADKIDKDSMLRDQITRLIFAIEHPSRTELMDDILTDMEMQIQEIDAEDSVAKDLEKTHFPTSSEAIDFEERLNSADSSSTVEKKEDKAFLERLENI